MAESDGDQEKPPIPAKAATSRYKVGDQVEAIYTSIGLGADLGWYKASIVGINGEVMEDDPQRYTLEWEDGGTQDTEKPAAKIQYTREGQAAARKAVLTPRINQLWQSRFENPRGSGEATCDQVITSRINDLQVTVAEKLGILDIYFEYKRKLREGEALHYKVIVCDITQGVCTAVVPILIPFSQTYRKVNVKVFGHSANLGVLLSIFAVLFSLAATVIHVYQSASKNNKNAQRDLLEASQTETELQTYLAGAGKYDTSDTDVYFNIEGNPDDARILYKLFVSRYQVIRSTSAAAYSEQLQGPPPQMKANKNKKKAKEDEVVEPK